MRKRDPIFWTASILSLVAIVIAALTHDPRWLFLLILSYLLRPTLAALGVNRRNVDERQMLIHYRSGNIAFAVMIVASVVMAVVQSRIGSPHWEAFTIVILLGLAAKALFNVVLVKNYREAGSRVIMSVGLLGGLVVLVDAGATVDGLAVMFPALVLVALGWLAPKFPKTIGAVTFAVAFVFMAVVLGKGRTLGHAAAALLVCVPLLLAAASLFAFGGRAADSKTTDAS